MALAGRALICPGSGLAAPAPRVGLSGAMGTAGRATWVALAEQAGMAQLLWGQHGQCQTRERTRGTAYCRGGRGTR